ncbi:RVP domain-containing protein [Trichonephila clavipes]|nr:RVP domain-containing protein [Trichonephila clavipes]
MTYLGKGQREDLFVLATELNLEFYKSMTIVTLKDLIIGSENYDEELTKNIHSTIVEDRKAREKKQEEQKEKLRIEEQREKSRIEEREERLRFEQLRTLKQKSSGQFVKNKNSNPQKRIADIKAQENSSITGKIRSFQRQRITTNDTKLPVTQVRICSKISRQRAERVKITALIDSGSTVSLLRENTSRRIMDPTKLSKNKMLLTGVAVIGSDLLEQASISFTKEGVKFNKYENDAQLMQISAENLQEELDLRHVENRQIKKELEKLIQDYSQKKQHLPKSQ